jgi:hypothetical protein
LVAYDLQAPAKNLYPVATPIRNRIPRVGGGIGLATNWRQVNSISGSGFDAMGWVPEGQRSGQMSYNTSNKSSSYVTLGEEDGATFEAISAGRTFEDVQARMTMRLLQKTMLKEEMAILGGNVSIQLGTPATPALVRWRLRRNPAERHLLGDRCRSHLRRHAQQLADERRGHLADHHRR